MLFRDSLKSWLGPELGIFLLVVVRDWNPGVDANGARGARFGAVGQGEGVCRGGGQRGDTSTYTIVWQHILPNVLSPIIVSATLGVAAAILTESALSFLGLGFPSNVPTWGRLLFENKDFHHAEPVAGHLAGHVHLADDSQH